MAGTSAVSPVRASTAYAPSAPSVTTASGTWSVRALAAARGHDVRVYRIASSALGRNASQCSRSASPARSHRPVSSQPTSAKIRVPLRAACAIQGARTPGVSDATAARARGGAAGGRRRPGRRRRGGGSWPWLTMVRSPSYAMETVTGVCQPGTVRDEARSMPSPPSRASQQYSP